MDWSLLFVGIRNQTVGLDQCWSLGISGSQVVRKFFGQFFHFIRHGLCQVVLFANVFLHVVKAELSGFPGIDEVIVSFQDSRVSSVTFFLVLGFSQRFRKCQMSVGPD